MNPHELISRLGQAGSRPLSFHAPAPLLPPPPPRGIVRPVQTVISLWTVLSKCSPVQSRQPSLVKCGHVTRVLPLGLPILRGRARGWMSAKGAARGPLGTGAPQLPQQSPFWPGCLCLSGAPGAPSSEHPPPRGWKQVCPGLSRCSGNICGRQEAKSALMSMVVLPGWQNEVGPSEPLVLSDASSGMMKFRVVWMVCSFTFLPPRQTLLAKIYPPAQLILWPLPGESYSARAGRLPGAGRAARRGAETPAECAMPPSRGGGWPAKLLVL